MAASRASLVKRPPQQGRAQLTRGRLLDVAGELLAEVGIERISTNMIAARAGLTPPALYRYFGDKYAVLEALGRRLMERQNAVLEDWLARHARGGIAAMADNIGDLLAENAAVTRAEPGAVWILRALHAAPRVAAARPCPARIAPLCDRSAGRGLRGISGWDGPRGAVVAAPAGGRTRLCGRRNAV